MLRHLRATMMAKHSQVFYVKTVFAIVILYRIVKHNTKRVLTCNANSTLKTKKLS